jgi:hypothetical protein
MDDERVKGKVDTLTILVKSKICCLRQEEIQDGLYLDKSNLFSSQYHTVSDNFSIIYLKLSVQPIAMFARLSESLRPLVESKYQAAKAASSVIYSPSQLAIIRTSTGIPVSQSVLLLYRGSLKWKPAGRFKLDTVPHSQRSRLRHPASHLKRNQIHSRTLKEIYTLAT